MFRKLRPFLRTVLGGPIKRNEIPPNTFKGANLSISRQFTSGNSTRPKKWRGIAGMLTGGGGILGGAWWTYGRLTDSNNKAVNKTDQTEIPPQSLLYALESTAVICSPPKNKDDDKKTNEKKYMRHLLPPSPPTSSCGSTSSADQGRSRPQERTSGREKYTSKSVGSTVERHRDSTASEYRDSHSSKSKHQDFDRNRHGAKGNGTSYDRCRPARSFSGGSYDGNRSGGPPPPFTRAFQIKHLSTHSLEDFRTRGDCLKILERATEEFDTDKKRLNHSLLLLSPDKLTEILKQNQSKIKSGEYDFQGVKFNNRLMWLPCKTPVINFIKKAQNEEYEIFIFQQDLHVLVGVNLQDRINHLEAISPVSFKSVVVMSMENMKSIMEVLVVPGPKNPIP